MARVMIIDLSIAPSVAPERWGKQDAYISYRDERGVLRTITIPAEEALTPERKLNIEKVKESIRSEEAWRAEYVGKEIEI